MQTPSSRTAGWVLAGILALLSLSAAARPVAAADAPNPLPGTAPLMMEGDIASHLVDGARDFLIAQTRVAIERGKQKWTPDFSTREKFDESVKKNRDELAKMLGLRDPRAPAGPPELVATVRDSAIVGHGKNYAIFAVRWRAFADVYGEGLMLLPTARESVADIVAIPDADQTPEQFCGLAEGVPVEDQLARRFAESGFRVIVPTLVTRERKPRNGRSVLTNREYIYRSAFEMGRHIIGYELQKVLAAVDWFDQEAGGKQRTIAVAGYGEGGRLALYAAALDMRIDGALVSGGLLPTMSPELQLMADEPIDRNVFGLLEGYDDRSLRLLCYPRVLHALEGRRPQVVVEGQGGAPGKLVALTEPGLAALQAAIRPAADLWPVEVAEPKGAVRLVSTAAPAERATIVDQFIEQFALKPVPASPAPTTVRTIDVAARQQRQIDELDRHNQKLLVDSPYVREEYWKNLDTKLPETFAKTVEPYRNYFKNEVIGWFDLPLADARPRTKLIESNDKWRRYQVVLDVFPISDGGPDDRKPNMVIAYGLLTIPADLKEGEKRPVVVCQHGLEGRPEDVIGQSKYDAYKAFATKLAERGFITFAPQNLYIFMDRFRYLQRLANPIKKTLFSIIIPQHQQIVKWLGSRPEVDAGRIAFYGLSYGGKSAMRIPPLVPEYCLSICSADFNEWVWKNAATHPKNRYSYVWTNEYEIFEFDLGSTFNYAEMATLIAPRPFMVERGHYDGVAPDETVGYEFAKVRFLYEARLKLQDRCEIEWFDGPHTINEQGTYAFLHKHLKWPVPK